MSYLVSGEERVGKVEVESVGADVVVCGSSDLCVLLHFLCDMV